MTLFHLLTMGISLGNVDLYKVKNLCLGKDLGPYKRRDQALKVLHQKQ